MINEDAFTWKLPHASTTWPIRFRDAKIDVVLSSLAVDFIPTFDGFDTTNSIPGDFFIGAPLWADFGDPVLAGISYSWPGWDYPVESTGNLSGLIGLVYVGGDLGQ